jgi:hypothetical protein
MVPRNLRDQVASRYALLSRIILMTTLIISGDQPHGSIAGGPFPGNDIRLFPGDLVKLLATGEIVNDKPTP